MTNAFQVWFVSELRTITTFFFLNKRSTRGNRCLCGRQALTSNCSHSSGAHVFLLWFSLQRCEGRSKQGLQCQIPQSCQPLYCFGPLPASSLTIIRLFSGAQTDIVWIDRCNDDEVLPPTAHLAPHPPPGQPSSADDSQQWELEVSLWCGQRRENTPQIQERLDVEPILSDGRVYSKWISICWQGEGSL